MGRSDHQAADVAHITAIVEAMPKAQNVDDLTKSFAADIAYFDILEDSAFGLADFRQKIGKQFKVLKDVRTKILALNVKVSGDMAFAYSTQNFLADTADGGTIDLIFRETEVFEKRNGEWLIVHQHLSVPVSLEKNEILMNSIASVPPGD